jgi:hypothetical protein
MQDGVVPILEDAMQYRLQYEVRKKLWKLYPPLRFTCNLLLFRCGAEGIRTPDLRRAKAALSQLSYGPGWIEDEFTRCSCVLQRAKRGTMCSP